MTEPSEKLAKPLTHEGRRLTLQARIDAQMDLVSRLAPGTQAHRLATDTLLVFQDTLFLLEETQRVLRIVHSVIASSAPSKK